MRRQRIQRKHQLTMRQECIQSLLRGGASQLNRKIGSGLFGQA
jgi:hypothetical protein